MAELGLSKATVSFGGPPLLDGIELQVQPRERIGLLGRNGGGKSTLLSLLGGELAPDSGEIARRQGLRVSSLAQEVPARLEGRVRDLLETALAEAPIAKESEDWQRESRIHRVLTSLDLLDLEEAEASALSAGQKRRALLARALVIDPDLLLLDEPTNHLDIESILRIEEILSKLEAAVVFVTHDRRFLDRIATRILDLDRGRLRSYDCGYGEYLKRKESELEAEAKQNAEFDKKLAKEEAWLRRGIPARRTRNQGRVRALEKLRDERGQRRDRSGNVRAGLENSSKSGRLVLESKGLSFSFGEKKIVDGFSCRVLRGDRIGILGPNGCGKTTLIELLLGLRSPDDGTIRRGTGLEIARFDQLGESLDESLSVGDNVSHGSDSVVIGGEKRHIVSYLGDFLFTNEQVRGPLRALSGGERKRLQLARILARPANLLVLDEPTNDLDVETLEVLETMLIGYPGTLILVSHDRAFLDNIVTSTIVFDADGRVREYVGGYEDWLRQRPKPALERAVTKRAAGRGTPAAQSRPERKRKLSYREQQELDALPQKIEELESEHGRLAALFADPLFYKKEQDEIAAAKGELDSVEAELSQSYERWEALLAIEAGEV